MKGFWEERFNELAVFNAANSRGLMHTQEFTERMRIMQEEYNSKLREWAENNGIKVVGG